MLKQGLLKYWWPLYRHSKLLGQRTDIYRNVEDSFALKHAFASMGENSVYLDIGSGASLVPSLIYQKFQSPTFATDLEISWVEKQKAFLKILKLNAANFHTVVADATDLDFPDGSCNFITVISTIEHIPSDGDSRAMREFHRVLAPGGRLVVTVPMSPVYTENQSTFYYAGFERRYDQKALHDRLHAQGLVLDDELYMVTQDPTIVAAIKQQFGEELAGMEPGELWYRRGWHDSYPDVSIMLTLGLIRLSPVNDGSAFGACLAYMKA